MSSTSAVNILSLTETSNTSGVPGWRDQLGFTFDVGNDFDPDFLLADPYGGYNLYLQQIKATLPQINTLRLFVNDYTFADPGKAEAWKEFVSRAAAEGFQLIITFADGQISNAITDPMQGWNRIDQIATGWNSVLTWINSNTTVSNQVYGYELMNEPEAYSRDAAGAVRYIEDLYEIYRSTSSWGAKKILIGGLGASSEFEVLDQMLSFAAGTFGPGSLAVTINGIDAIKSIILGAAASSLVWSYHAYSKWLLTHNAEDYAAYFQDRLNSVLGDNILLTEFSTEREHLLDYSGLSTEPQHFAFMHALRWFSDNGIGIGYWSATDTPDGAEIFLPSRTTTINGGIPYSLIHHDAVARLLEVWIVGDPDNGLGGNDSISASPTSSVKFGFGGNDTLTGNASDTEHAIDAADLRVMAPSKLLLIYNALMGTSYTQANNAFFTAVSGNLVAFNGAIFNPAINTGIVPILPSGVPDWTGFGDRFARFGPLSNEVLDKLYGGDGNDLLNLLGGDDYGFGGAQNDTINGGSGNDQIFGGDGNDALYGNSTVVADTGSDFIEGGAGSDLIYGGSGNDTILGGSGNQNEQKLYGGAGADIFAFDQGDTARIMDFNLAEDKIDVTRWEVDRFTDIRVEDKTTGSTYVGDVYVRLYSGTTVVEEIRVSLGSANLHASDLDVTKFVFQPGVQLTGTSAAESLSGGTGPDTVIGNDGNDTISGFSGGDYLYGGLGNDVISGHDGDDFIYGGMGSKNTQKLFGGEGDDTFIFAHGESGRVMDFDVTSDVVNIAAWGVAGYANLVLIDRPGGAGSAGIVVVQFKGTGTTVIDEIELNLGDPSLDRQDVTAANFIFT